MDIEQLGPYQLRRELGRGGMGTVYEGVNLDNGEPAAVKLLAASLARQEGFRERFEAEIQTLLKLNHPNIVRLFGFGEQHGDLFYAMELVDGPSLEEELRQGRRFDWREVTRIGIEMCGALRHAHDRGIIHRDIKPGNLLQGSDGRVKLSDFGIARLFGNAGITTADSILGTAEYMAPEQAAGKPVGPRSDLYSLGAVFYVLLTRRTLFQAKTLAEVLHKQQYEQPEPVSEYADDLPEMLGQIVDQLVEKDPRKRIPSPALLERQLRAMEHALSLRLEWDDPSGEDDPTGEDIERPESEVSDEPPADIGRVPPTRRASGATEPSSGVEPTERPMDSQHPDRLAETKRTAAFEKLVTAPIARKSASEDHFTAVAEGDLDRADRPETPPAWVSPRTWMLVASLIVVGLAVWYFLQPPSADRLYEQIRAQTADGTVSTLGRAEDRIDRFLHLYPNDDRCKEISDYKRQIDLVQLERKFRLRSKGLATTENLAPIERSYLEAIHCLQYDADRALVKLEAIVDLYDGQADPTGPTADCLELARRRVDQLRQQIERQAAKHLAVIKVKLQQAAEIRKTDPSGARRRYRAILELYREKPWAAEPLNRARDALAEIEPDE